MLGAEFTAVKDFERWGLDHDVVYGAEVSGSRLEEMRNGTQTDLATGATTKTILGETYPLRDFPNSDVIQAGAFLQDEIRFGDGRWSVIPALRVDYYDLSPKPDSLYREDNPDTPVVGLHDTSLSPKLGLTRRIGDALSAYFQYSNGFRAPPPEDVNIGLDLPLLNVRAIPNPDLKPEQSNGYEIGLRYDGGALRFAASAYYTDYDDFIESKVNLGVDPETQVILFQSQNIERARIYGTEVSASATAGDGAAALTGWTARVSAAWSKGEDLERNQPLNSVDPGRALISVAYVPASGAWRGELVTTAVAAKREVDRSRADLYRTRLVRDPRPAGAGGPRPRPHVECGAVQPDRPGLHRVDRRARTPGGRSAHPVLHAAGPKRFGHAALAVLSAQQTWRVPMRSAM